MARAIKLRNDYYWDSTGVTHNRKPLNELLNSFSSVKFNQLWSGRLTTNNTTVNLNDSRKNYDLILIIGCGDTGSKARPSSNLLTNTAIDATGTNYVTLMVPYTSGSPVILHFGFPSDTTLKSVSGFTKYFVLTEVWGIKF